jgi:hypothetical protein
MNPLRTLNIYYPALAEGVCPTLHPYLEEYEVELASEARGVDPVIIYLDAEG